MKKVTFFLLALAVNANAQWATLGTNVLGQAFDYVTIQAKNDGHVLTYRAADNKWIAAAGGGGGGAHASTHENGGADEISVAGLSGLLADAQTPLAHAASHENGGADEVSVAGLSGLLADPQTPLAHDTSHENGGADEINVGGLNGELADPQPPKAHATSHQHGGTDQVATATPGANAIPKADGSNKLALGWLSEVLGLADLTGVTGTTGSGTVVPFATSPDLTTPNLNNGVVPADKYTHYTGQAGSPAGFPEGGVGYNTTRKTLIVKTLGGVHSAGGVIYCMQTNSVTLTDPTVNTTIPFPAGELGPTGTVTPTFAASTLGNGEAFQFFASGLVTVFGDAAQFARIELRMNGEVIGGTSVAFARVSTQTNRVWVINGTTVFRTPTAQQSNGFVQIGSSDNPTTANFNTGQFVSRSVLTAVDTNAGPVVFEVVVSCGVSNAINEISMTSFVIRR
jgi:hypothetical protein